MIAGIPIIGIVLILAAVLICIFLCTRKWLTRGERGEKAVADVLQTLGIHYHILNDILIEGVHGDTQIDHVVVSPFGIFVIETKCWTGWISGSENSEKWTQTIFREKYEKDNPLGQNKVHVEAVKRNLQSYGDLLIIPIIVIVGCDRLLVKAKDNIIIRLYQLNNEIQRYERILYTDSQCELMTSTLMGMSSDDPARRQQHIEKVQNYQTIVQNKINSGICPKCGGSLILRTGRYGRFYGCSNYPHCRYIINNV